MRFIGLRPLRGNSVVWRLVNDGADGGGLSLNQWRLGSDGNGLTLASNFKREVDAHGAFNFQLEGCAGQCSEALFTDCDLIDRGLNVDELIIARCVCHRLGFG